MKIRINNIIDESIVDGSGIRMTVFVQGCEHHCPGCHNPQTHPLDGGYEDDTIRIAQRYEENELLQGITFSGGEPFLQQEPLCRLADTIHHFGGNVWAYTGFTLWELNRQRAPLLDHIDVLIDGPFLMEKRSLSLKWRGSSNQGIYIKCDGKWVRVDNDG